MTLPVGVGLGWRPATAWLVDTRPTIAFTEVIAEAIDPARPPPALAAAVRRGRVVVPHGVALGLGGASPPDPARLARLAAVARALRAPLVSEHVALVRGGGHEVGHLMPVPRTRAQLALTVDNVRRAQDALPVPLALENVAAPLRWPGDQLAEADFLAEVIERTGAHLLLDAANLLANLRNHGGELDVVLDRLPLGRVAYVHVAGGARIGARWRDTHAHPISPDLLGVLAAILARTGPRPVLLERDHGFGARAALEAELDALEAAVAAAPPVTPTTAPAQPPLSTTAAERARLAADHAALVAALVAGAPEPPGFAAADLAEARAILADRNARHAHP